MGIVGVNSTAGRAVKCIDPSKTTKSESSWLGYTLCDYILFYASQLYRITHTHTIHYTLQYILMYIHFTMKNEGWGIKEDQIPSSSHLLHQTMGSQLHILLSVVALNLQKNGFELVFLYVTRSPTFFRTVSMDISFLFFLRVSILVLLEILAICVYTRVSELCAHLFGEM